MSGIVLGAGLQQKTSQAINCLHGTIINMSKGVLFVSYCFVFVFSISSCDIIGNRN